MLIKKSNTGFFHSQREVTLMIKYGQFSNSFEILSIYLICKFQEDPFKTEWVMLMTKSNRGFFSNQGDGILRLKILSGQFSNSTQNSSISTLSATFRKIQSKLNELMWWQTFSHCKSMGPCGCHSNHDFHWISMKSLCHRCPTRSIL